MKSNTKRKKMVKINGKPDDNKKPKPKTEKIRRG